MRLIFTGTTQGHKWAAIQYLNVTASSRSAGDLSTLLASVNTAAGTWLKPHWAPQTAITLLTGVWMTPGPSEIVATNATVQAGTNGGTTMDSSAGCYVVNWHISAYYRGGHPRQYVPGPVSSVISNGSDISNTDIANVQSGALTYLNAVNALTAGAITAVTLGTVSYQTGGAWRTPPIFRPFVGVSVRQKLGTQRRRITS